MDAETLSTTIDTEASPSAAGAGMPKIAEPDTPISARDDMAAAFKEADEAAKPEAKDDKAGKVEPNAKDAEKAPVVKEEAKAEPDKVEAKDGEGEEKSDPEKTEAKDETKSDRRHPDAPAKFMPRAKELWRNTPNEVKAEVDRVLREAEEETIRVRETTERYEAIRPYDELARQNGRAGIHESLEEVRQLEDLMQQNPIAALNRILMQAGPRKADGQPVSLFEMANHIVQQGPQGYQQMVAQQPQRQQQANPEVANLRAELAEIKVQQAAKDIIEPFAAKNPRYHELQDDIAFFLQSGKIPAGLSPTDRLAHAYDMAERINPSSTVRTATADEPPTDRRAADFDGSAKSIKSSPGSVSEDVESEAAGGETIAESIRKAMRVASR